MEFNVFADNSTCKWFLSHPKVSGKLARWLAFVGQYSFVLHHVKGSSNVVADALSRVDNQSSKSRDQMASTIPVISGSTLAVHSCAESCVDLIHSYINLSLTSWPWGNVVSMIFVLFVVLDVFGGGNVVTRSTGVPHEVTLLKPCQLTMVTVKLDMVTKKMFLREYRHNPIYRDVIRKTSSPKQEIPGIGAVRKENELLFKDDV
ncbi:polyprotein [Phytophthora megakarya]|uniref:Polyprotein n=1 Tax=Phytophthora megakarya TaxID=4795 RepID=A0A225VTK2_9STRA|nr:polyprotein [Phytophthora megakarya]